MAHFAQLDENNIVTQVIVVNNQECLDENGVEQEAIGVAFCQSLFGQDTVWKQTSYNGNIRKRYAGIGYSYDEQKDAFIIPKPYPSWLLDEVTLTWVAPTDPPVDHNTKDANDNWIIYEWDEDAYQADNMSGWILSE